MSNKIIIPQKYKKDKNKHNTRKKQKTVSKKDKNMTKIERKYKS